MDSVSRLVRLARLTGVVDVRCLMAGSFDRDHPASGPGAVPFHLVLDGHCTVTSDTAGADLGPGDLLLLPHGDAHRVSWSDGARLEATEAPGPSFATRQSVGAAPELDLFCGHYCFEPGAGALLFRLMPPMVHVSLDSPALALADVLRGEARFDGPGTSAIVAALLDALLAMALRSRPGQRLDTPALWTAMGDDAIGRVIAAVIDDPGAAWTIDRLAAAASMSRATFIRRFTARTGTTVMALLTAIRMMLAADLLARTDHSVTRVAREVGYRSESAFAQAFRSMLDTSPAQYRKDSAGLE